MTVRSSTWLQELSLLQRELIARINEWMKREVVRELFFVVGRVEHNTPETLARGHNARPTPGEPQGQRRRDDAPPNDEIPSTDDLSPDVAATFERLWRAARARQDEKKNG